MSASLYFRWAGPPIAAVAWLLAGTAHAQLPNYLGRPIRDLIDALRNDGARIVYSESLVTADLLVAVEPTDNDPIDGLREILAPYGLELELGPGDAWLIVPLADASLRPADRSNVRPPLTRPTIETIIVTASRYPIERQAPANSNSFGRHTLETTPALGQDPIRVTHRLPGVSSDKLTSRIHVRGGSLDEVLLTLDGVRLYSPYHLKDFQNVFSSINPRIVDSMEVRTGGFEARFGDRMSGVISMETVEPTERRHHEVAVSFLDATVLSSGTFAAEKASWVTSVRRGNLDVLANSGDSGIGTPQYVDFFNKLTYAPSDTLTMETGALSLDDKISLQDQGEATAAADYNDTYYWATVAHETPAGLAATYRFSSTNLNRTRVGEIDAPDRSTGSLSERSKFDRLAVSADWSISLSDSHWLSWGLESARADHGHRFQSSRTELLTVLAPELDGRAPLPDSASVRIEQTERSYFVSFRYRPLRRLTAEFGLRRDDQSLDDASQTTPRINARFDVSARTSVRAAWGRFAQAEWLSELALADGVMAPRPAEESRHSILGIEHLFGTAILLRAEIYKKRADKVNASFENLLEKVSLLPELLPDRFVIAPIDAETDGAELSIEGSRDRFAWWANIAFARSYDHLPTGTFRRSWDERRSIKAGGDWTGAKWQLAASIGYRSGWPISTISAAPAGILVEHFNGNRFPNFSSVDVNVRRTVEVARGSLEWFVEIGNLFDHSNYCCVDYRLVDSEAGMAELRTDLDELLGIVPNLGIRWQL